MLLSQVIRNALDLLVEEGDIEVFSVLYTPDDIQLSTDKELYENQKAHVIEVLNSSNANEDSIKDLIEDAIERIPEPPAQSRIYLL